MVRIGEVSEESEILQAFIGVTNRSGNARGKTRVAGVTNSK